jgi:hypothetical protein
VRPNTRYPSDRPASVPWPPEAPSAQEARCPVQAECLVFALRTRQLHGIWGGTTERERYQLWRGDERGTDPDPADGRPGHPHGNQRRPRISLTSAASPGSRGRGR